MARVIDKLPRRQRTMGGAPTKYPYDEWLDGRAWVLLYGEDYRCRHKSMEGILRRAATGRSGVVEVRRLEEDGEQIGMAIQFTPFSANGDRAHE